MSTTTSDVPKETKAQRVERLKRAKNPWEALAELREYARHGFEAIPPEWEDHIRSGYPAFYESPLTRYYTSA